MAKKKSKRPNLPQETLDRARAERRGETLGSVPVVPVVEKGGSNGTTAVAAKPKVAKRSPAMTRRIPSIPELIQEYSYVLSDLRFLVILAVFLFVAIIAAALLLPRPIG